MSEIETGEFQDACDRSLGLIDQNPLSATAGSSDRGYWHYLDQKVFEVASPLASMLGLSGAEDLFPGTSVYGQAADLQLQRWVGLILQNGKVDEYFLSQKSFCASAFTALAAGFRGWMLIQKRRSLPAGFDRAFHRAVTELAEDHDRPQSANQAIAGRLALNLGRLMLPNEKWPNAANIGVPFDEKDEVLLEYGGFDLGYSLKCVDLLALSMMFPFVEEERRYFRKTLVIAMNSLERAVLLGTFASDLSSRGNPHCFLGGLSLLRRFGSLRAASLIKELETRSCFSRLVRHRQSDDKYLAMFHLTSLYLQTVAAGTIPHWLVDPGNFEDTPLKPTKENDHHTSRFSVIRQGAVRICISWQRGGVIALETRTEFRIFGQHVFEDQAGLKWVTPAGAIKSEPIRNGKIEWVLTARPFHQKTGLLQNRFVSFGLKIFMTLPFFSSMLRKILYQNSKPSQVHKPVGTISLSVVPKVELITCRWKEKPLRLYRVTGWSFQEGHATRLHRRPQEIFQPIDVGEEIEAWNSALSGELVGSTEESHIHLR